MELRFAIATVGVAASLWLAYVALTSDSVPFVGSVRGALLAMVIIGMASCAVAGVSQAPVIGWTNPLSIFGIVVGVLALVVAAAGLFGWDAVLSPVSGIVPVGGNVAATTERLAIGVLAALFVVKWLAGIPVAFLVGGR